MGCIFWYFVFKLQWLSEGKRRALLKNDIGMYMYIYTHDNCRFSTQSVVDDIVNK